MGVHCVSGRVCRPAAPSLPKQGGALEPSPRNPGWLLGATPASLAASLSSPLDEVPSIRGDEPSKRLRAPSRQAETLRCSGARPETGWPKPPRPLTSSPRGSFPAALLPFEAFPSPAAVPPVTVQASRPERSPGACCPPAVATRVPDLPDPLAASVSPPPQSRVTFPSNTPPRNSFPVRPSSWRGSRRTSPRDPSHHQDSSRSRDTRLTYRRRFPGTSVRCASLVGKRAGQSRRSTEALPQTTASPRRQASQGRNPSPPLLEKLKPKLLPPRPGSGPATSQSAEPSPHLHPSSRGSEPPPLPAANHPDGR